MMATRVNFDNSKIKEETNMWLIAHEKWKGNNFWTLSFMHKNGRWFW